MARQSYRWFWLSIAILCPLWSGCKDAPSDKDDHQGQDTVIRCDTSDDCSPGYGCHVFRHECIDLSNERQCLSDKDCTDRQICVRYAPAKNAEDASSTFCTFSCDQNGTEECQDKGMLRKCSDETKEHDYNEHTQFFCGRIPSTCGNGRLDADELCDLDESGQFVFSVDQPTCQLWEPKSTFKPGGLPGCATTCIAYTKGSGKTKCVYASEPNNVNGFDTCLASLYIDQDTYMAYATVNYATTKASDLDGVEGYLLCGPAGNVNMKILTDEDKLPEASQDIEHCLDEDCTSRVLYITRDLSTVTSAVGKAEGQCVVYLKLASSKLGVVCDLTYKDNPLESIPPTGTMPSAAVTNPNACVTIAGTEDDFDIYEAFLANINCVLSQYPYVSYIPPESGSNPPPSDAFLLAAWDEFPAFKTDAGYPVKAQVGLELLQAGLPAEQGICLEDMICDDAMLSLSVVGTNGFQKSSVTQTAGTQGLFETLQIGGSKNDWATEKPIEPYQATHLTISLDGLDVFRDRRLSFKGKLDKGQILVTYYDGESEHLIAEDVSMPSKDARCSEDIPEEEKQALGCPDENNEGTLQFSFPDDVKITEFRIYVYGSGSDNLNLNWVQVWGISNVIY